MDADILIQARGLTLKQGERVAISDVNFALHRGEIVTIIGPNGSGKSTLVKGLIGGLQPFHGSVTKQSGLKFGYVPQSLHVDNFFPLTVRDFLSLPVRQSAEAMTQALAKAGVPGLERRQISALSRGQFQRVMLARALMATPDVLILDEPTQGLDQPGAAAFYKQIAGLRDEIGCAVLMVSHDLHVVMAASDRVLCLNGHVCCEGTPEIVQNAPEYHALFGGETGGAFALYRHEHDHHHDTVSGPDAHKAQTDA